jgi:hypothetical protein
MTAEPLQPFSPPTLLPGISGVSSGSILEWFLYLVLLFWAVYTVVAIYHWLKYSHASMVAVPAIGMHLGVSFVLIAYTLSGSIPYLSGL